jgi:glycosyltransferase involved in cell wall biosynthesis
MRAISSVQSQAVDAEIVHSIVVDDCRETLDFLRRSRALPENVQFQDVPRRAGVTTGPARAARLRNLAIDETRNEWVAFLDDDNEFLPHHLSTLLDLTAVRGYDAAHSYRQLRHPNGAPYLEKKDPWCQDEVLARQSYERLVAEGILSPGSCVMKDKAILNGPRSVDTSEWLVSRSVLETVRFGEHYSEEDFFARRTEDDLFAQEMIASGIRIATTRLATLIYYIGGYSTIFGVDAEWHPESTNA